MSRFSTVMLGSMELDFKLRDDFSVLFPQGESTFPTNDDEYDEMIDAKFEAARKGFLLFLKGTPIRLVENKFDNAFKKRVRKGREPLTESYFLEEDGVYVPCLVVNASEEDFQKNCYAIAEFAVLMEFLKSEPTEEAKANYHHKFMANKEGVILDAESYNAIAYSNALMVQLDDLIEYMADEDGKLESMEPQDFFKHLSEHYRIPCMFASLLAHSTLDVLNEIFADEEAMEGQPYAVLNYPQA